MKCPVCDLENPSNSVRCECGYVNPLPSDPKLISLLQSIDGSIRTIRRIMVWWFILTIIGGVIVLIRTLV